MKPFPLLGGLLLSLVSSAIAQQPKPVETQWPGISAEIFQITRLADNHAAAIFHFASSTSAPEFTLISSKLIQKLDKEGILAFEDGPPFSIETGKLIDEGNGKVYSRSEPQIGGEAMPVDSAQRLNLPRSSGFLIGLVFDCPPVNLDDPPKKQFVTFQLPGLKSPITGVPLPREIDKPISFSRKKEDPAKP